MGSHERQGVTPLVAQLVDFAHARTSVARQGMRVPSVGPVPPSVVHPDTAGSDVFERFEELCVDAKSDAESLARCDPQSNPLRVTTQFDARVHRGTQRETSGPKSYVDQSAPRKTGPLRTLFLAYARRDDHRRRDAPLFFSRNADADADADADGSLLSRAEVFGMMRDFDVMPSLLHERDVRVAFAHADAPAVGDAAAANRENELDFHEFCRFLANAATLLASIFAVDPNDDKRESVKKSALRLLRRLECDSRDTRCLRAKVDEAFRAADRNPRAEEGALKKINATSSASGAALGVGRGRDAENYASKESALKVVVSMKGVSLDDPRRADEIFVDAFRVLTRRENPERDEPKWTEFQAPAVDCGTLFPGETRRFRVRVANTNTRGSVSVRVWTQGVPCVEARFKETKVLAPGLTETVQLVAGADAAGEWLGAVIVEGVSIRETETTTCKVVVPVYLNVVHRDREIVVRAGETLGMRGFERANGVAGVTEPGREKMFGFRAQRPPREADAAERRRMRDPVFVSKSATATNAPLNVTVSNRAALSAAALAAGDRFAAAASARDRGWWGEKSEERVFHEMANMREMARDEAKMKTTKRFTRDEANAGRETAGAAETAFRLSKRGLRY